MIGGYCVGAFPRRPSGLWMLDLTPPTRGATFPSNRWGWAVWSHGTPIHAEGVALTMRGAWRQGRRAAEMLNEAVAS